MTKKTLLTLFILAAGLLTVSAQDKFDYDKYQLRTLSDIVRQYCDPTMADVTFTKEKNPQDYPETVLFSDFLHSEVKVKFLDQSRPISAERREILGHWKEAYQIEEKIARLYENEYLFTEGDREFWIPVQKQVAEFFPKELKKGDTISLFIIRIGGRRAGGGKDWDWLFLATEFDAPEPANPVRDKTS